ncbi:carbonic anhydrase [Sulfuriflexus mobilis]|uniref:carbonic anhydrase n=1 Tax=Sulfuriflexus mobilis TaxID=1811807 RepID=UPI000F81DA26|nr:carbonic anhydrase [Sulfuriflexus mobilis]
MSAIDDLIAGYRRFRGGYYETNRDEFARLRQSPKIAVVACCDSRVDPAVITDSTTGELFVIRNVANLVPPCEGQGERSWHGTSAALQFAVCDLAVEHLIVLGHARCGGIRALLEGQAHKHEDGFIASWMSIADEACERAMARDDLQTFDERAHACELDAIGISLANLKTFPWIRERVEQNSLQLHGWYYDMMTGDLLRLDEGEGGFVSLY